VHVRPPGIASVMPVMEMSRDADTMRVSHFSGRANGTEVNMVTDIEIDFQWPMAWHGFLALGTLQTDFV
jgi:hypothetical protein